MKKVGIVINPDKQGAEDLCKAIIKWCKKNNIYVKTDLEFVRDDIAVWADTIVAIGGDGTLLNIARRLKKSGIAIVGINMGGLGFLTEVKQDEVFQTFNDIKRGRAKFSIRKVFLGSLYRDNKKVMDTFFINDAVVQRGSKTRILSLTVFVENEEMVSYLCDGLIVATPTGSTAHSLSANGPIIHPQTQGFVVTPICPHILSNRSIVLPDEKEVCITVDESSEAKDVALMVDGQEGFLLKPLDRIYIKSSKINFRLVMSPNRTYFQMLREKLCWGVRAKA
jgi:NAD+ kinase